MNDLIIFDGVCNLCTFSVRFILQHETAPHLHFTPLQSPAGMRLLELHGFDPNDTKTFVLIQNGQVYTRSEAALRVAKYLRWPWRGLVILRIIPPAIRDWAYDYIARHRYRWFGQKAVCMLPTPELRARFVED
ncbi:MAG: thiol-disulfide oxidoreductase DCC family protein [Thiothrix sp.]|nr:MAG: thiol-disulfide oxidoreductase DCC family protein [Thiothrix sp.]